MTPKSSAAWSLLAAADPAPWDAYLVVLRTSTPQQIMDAYLEYRTAHPEFRRLYRLHKERLEEDEVDCRRVARQIVEMIANAPDRGIFDGRCDECGIELQGTRRSKKSENVCSEECCKKLPWWCLADPGEWVLRAINRGEYYGPLQDGTHRRKARSAYRELFGLQTLTLDEGLAFPPNPGRWTPETKRSELLARFGVEVGGVVVCFDPDKAGQDATERAAIAVLEVAVLEVAGR